MAAKKKALKTIVPSDIRPASYNPRFIEEQSKVGLSKSMEQFGDLSGITWNRKTKNLVTGHQRWNELQAKYLDLTFKMISESRIEIISKKSGPTGFFIRIVDWDLVTEKAANVSANNPNIQGQFDNDALQSVLDDIKEGFDVSMFQMLQLEPLVVGEWVSDIESIKKTKENLDGIVSKVVIACKQEDKEDLIEFLKKSLKETDFEGLSIT